MTHRRRIDVGCIHKYLINLGIHRSLQLFNFASRSPSENLLSLVFFSSPYFFDKNDRRTYIHIYILDFFFFLLKDVLSSMATYENVGLIHSPNLNNNNNNTPPPLASTLGRDTHDYSSKNSSSKTFPMPKYFHQHTTKPSKRDVISSQNGCNHSTLSENDVSTNSNDSSKRLANTNGKFSIQKMIRQGFSSWRTKKKPPTPSLSTPPLSTISSDMSSPPSIPSSLAHQLTTDNDFCQVHPLTTAAARSTSIDGIVNQISPQRIIVTEQITSAPVRANSVDNILAESDRTSVNHRGYIQSPWANSSVPTNRTQPGQLPESSSPTKTEPIPLPTNAPKIPPPGTDISCISLDKHSLFCIYFSCPETRLDSFNSQSC